MSSEGKQYKNYWKNNILYFMGMGTKNQSVSFFGNKRLTMSKEANTTIFLIEIEAAQIYRFKGEVTLCGKPFYKTIKNTKGEEQCAVFFPLKYV